MRFWRAMRRAGELAGLLWQMIRDPRYRFAWKTKLIVVLSLLYFLSPIDLIVDLLPVLGFADDGALLVGVVGLLLSRVLEYEKRRNGVVEITPIASPSVADKPVPARLIPPPPRR